MKVLISTDSSAKIRKDFFDNYDISVYPLNVIIDGEEFLDGVTINPDQLCEAMRAKKIIKTSTPPLGEIIEYFENLFAKGYDHIIHFTISSKLSSMYDLFCNVAAQHFSGKLTIVDSYALCSVMLSHVMFAYDEVQKGSSVEKIVNDIEERKKHTYIFFIPENLTALKNGGRISPTVALIGNTIGIKPVLLLSNGELVKEGMTRRVRKTFEEKVLAIKNDYPYTEYDYYLAEFDVEPEKAQQISDVITTVLGGGEIIRGLLPINVCAHCGPGTTGLVISPRINGKSLSEFIK